MHDDPVWIEGLLPLPGKNVYPVAGTWACMTCAGMLDVPQALQRTFFCVTHGMCMFYLRSETIEYAKRLV